MGSSERLPHSRSRETFFPPSRTHKNLSCPSQYRSQGLSTSSRGNFFQTHGYTRTIGFGVHTPRDHRPLEGLEKVVNRENSKVEETYSMAPYANGCAQGANDGEHGGTRQMSSVFGNFFWRLRNHGIRNVGIRRFHSNGRQASVSRRIRRGSRQYRHQAAQFGSWRMCARNRDPGQRETVQGGDNHTDINSPLPKYISLDRYYFHNTARIQDVECFATPQSNPT